MKLCGDCYHLMGRLWVCAAHGVVIEGHFGTGPDSVWKRSTDRTSVQEDK
jgi:hypothetical protein